MTLGERRPGVLYDSAMGVPAAEQVIAWRPPIAGVREVLHASHVRHAYPPHAHETWTLFIVDLVADRSEVDDEQRPRFVGVARVRVPDVRRMEDLADAGDRRSPRDNELSCGDAHRRIVQDRATGPSLPSGA